jgi:hypothetical protein
MSSAYTPLGTFLHKGDADKVRELLAREGLNVTVRAAGDGPQGWLKAPGQTGFVVWVQGADPKVAMETCLRVMAEAFPGTAPHCEVCGGAVATHDISVISGGKRMTRHLCAACYGEEILPPFPDQL